jgi:anthranilate synthase/aminodeoxychorismate synthase-like glutamine amidotransferase
MILVIDNYDSFTYNLVQLIMAITPVCTVVRNDQMSVAGIREINPRAIVISPGPGRPEHAGISMDVIRNLGGTIPVFGVCLGHQAIGLAFGATVTYAPSLMHGRTSLVHHAGGATYHGVPDPFSATRYHSLVVASEQLPPSLEVTAWTADGVVMGIRHRELPIEGVQFHPESILTKDGSTILRNWMEEHQCL